MKLFLLLFLLNVFINAQNELMDQKEIPEIMTDRPDITESAIAVSPGYFQFEDGFILENQNINTENIRIYTFSSLLARIGVINSLELRLGGDYLHQVIKLDNNQSANSGLNNLLIGAKYQFMKEEIYGFDFGLIMQIYLPVGNKSLRPNNVEPEILLASGKNLTDIFSISANLGTHWNSADNILVFLYSASFGISINDGWDSFIEIFGDASGNSQAAAKFDFGFACRPITNFQVDISAGNESFSNFNSWFIASGLSIRLPH